jgi:hypothetical protein
MITIGSAIPADPQYEKISDFAREVYGKKLHAMIAGKPTIFTYVETAGVIIGCFGLYEGRLHSPLLFETYFPDDVFGKFFQDTRTDRSLIGEIGTRAVMVPDNIAVSSMDVSIALSSALILMAGHQGIRYLGFTANRSVRKITDALELHLITLGEPDLSGKDEEFRENWKEFFRIKQQCFIIDVAPSLTGCRKVIQQLTKKGFIAESQETRALYSV